MKIEVLKSKLQQVNVTEANLAYRGSITIDEDLMDEADMHEWELVHVNNATNGTRLITYILKGRRGSGEILMNGGAALHAKKGDKIHILSFCSIKKSKAKSHEPIIILTDDFNKVIGKKRQVKNEKISINN
ncbi:aspartate 1-decarboxylase [Portibacter lacus]|uniref:Aspartate 1-decarboxylase n=1 Tax=Portibacter lacus TaxID=1099794 RepID=A0AA37SXI5_9BACT|nr:aspartate 1-decarboxylase [Portibacter lacus]GLR19623.1 aspartate 1-decarboxylase [Portibacter lacus]